MPKNKGKWDLVISAENNWLKLKVKELWDYRDLLWILVEKEYKTYYKQTILGPIWFIVQPTITMIIFAFIFNKIAKIDTNDTPPYLFYLSGIIAWNYFSDCLTSTSSTFTANVNIFGKVYFPRIIIPLSKVIAGLIKFFIQLFLFFCIYFYFIQIIGISLKPSLDAILFIPIMIIQMIFLGLGFGMIFSSLTIKYRDLTYLASFGTQLLMYGSPIIYPLSTVPEKYKYLIMINPMTSIIEGFRYTLLEEGFYNFNHSLYSFTISFLVFIFGLIIFNKFEKTFMDSV